jgi:hypothetical protein
MPQVKNLKFSGRVGPVVFYFVGDKLHSRRVPEKVRQSPNTKIRSANFGVAARAGKALRRGLAGALPYPKDRQMQSGLSGAIAKWLALQPPGMIPPAEDMKHVQRFRFAGLYAFEENFRLPIAVSRKDNNSIEIDLPAFTPKKVVAWPNDVVSIDCTFAATGCTLTTGASLTNHLVRWNIPCNDIEIPAQTFSLPCEQPNGSFILVTGTLIFNVVKNGNKVICDKPSYVTCSVIKSYYL